MSENETLPAVPEQKELADRVLDAYLSPFHRELEECGLLPPNLFRSIRKGIDFLEAARKYNADHRGYIDMALKVSGAYPVQKAGQSFGDVNIQIINYGEKEEKE